MRLLKTAILNIAALAARLLPASLKKQLYRSPFLARSIRRSLNTVTPLGVTPVVIAGGSIRGLTMALDLQTEKDYWLGTYETDLQAALERFIQPGDVVYDVGANIGYISLVAARCSGAQGCVYAFEALPENIRRLEANIALNHLETRISAIHSAVVDHSGLATFYVHPSGAMGKAEGSHGRQADYAGQIEVPGLALDDFILGQGNPPPRLVKLDIEGGEGMALAGMVRTLQEFHPIFLVELHGQQASREVWQVLKKNGYSIHQLQRGYPLISGLDQLDWKAYIVAQPGDQH
jgi:FkbM family methyltransferase